MQFVLKRSLLYLTGKHIFLFILEKLKHIPSCISVSPKGQQYLSSARPDYQPPLVLPVSSEMLDDEEHNSISGEVEEFKSLATSEFKGYSEVGKIKC